MPRLAQAQARQPVIGFLNGASYELSAHLVKSFSTGLAEIGYADGENVKIDYVSADGQYDRLPGLAAELVRRNVDVIAATGTPTGLPAKAATTTIPIVFVTGSDPVAQGLVDSLNRPSANVTGVTTLAVEMGQKRLELLHEVSPLAGKIAALVNPKGPNLASVTADLEGAARTLGLPLQILHASTVAELDAAFATLGAMEPAGLVIGTDTFFNSQSVRLAELSTRHALPAIYQYREFAAAGGLLSYGGSILDAYREAGTYCGRILKGAKPGDLPVQQSTKAELFVNLKTARALKIEVPPSVMVRADELIE